MRFAHIILTAALTSCTWISKDDLAAREPQLDNDGDGVVAENDCDDNNADISPRKGETWYDGIDGNCGADDDFDADADGYVATQYAGLQTKGGPKSPPVSLASAAEAIGVWPHDATDIGPITLL